MAKNITFAYYEKQRMQSSLAGVRVNGQVMFMNDTSVLGERDAEAL